MRCFLFTLVCFSFLVLPSAAQQPVSTTSAGEALPGIELILEKYEKAVGDRNVAEKLTSVEMKGTIEVVSAGLSRNDRNHSKSA